jgi:hypothetical protein
MGKNMLHIPAKISLFLKFDVSTIITVQPGLLRRTTAAGRWEFDRSHLEPKTCWEILYQKPCPKSDNKAARLRLADFTHLIKSAAHVLVGWKLLAGIVSTKMLDLVSYSSGTTLPSCKFWEKAFVNIAHPKITSDTIRPYGADGTTVKVNIARGVVSKTAVLGLGNIPNITSNQLQSAAEAHWAGKVEFAD